AAEGVTPGEAAKQIGVAAAGLAVGGGSAVDRHDRRGAHADDGSVVRQSREIRAYSEQRHHVDEGDAVGGAIFVDLKEGAAVGSRDLQEVVDVGNAGRKADEQAAHVDRVATGKTVETEDGIDAIEAAADEDEIIAAGAADQAVGALGR